MADQKLVSAISQIRQSAESIYRSGSGSADAERTAEALLMVHDALVLLSQQIDKLYEKEKE
jgi:hypothetical protein